MNAGAFDAKLVRRHLLALDAAVSLLDPQATIDLDTYLSDRKLQWFVERGLQLCAQNVLDIAAHLTASAGVDSADYAQSIDGLGSLGVLPVEFAQELRRIAGLRNVLVHAYLKTDPTIVHDALTQKLPQLRAFASHVQAYLDRA
jgi:uncharacterized protein YutE (UPF0331/DUF86 family)